MSQVDLHDHLSSLVHEARSSEQAQQELVSWAILLAPEEEADEVVIQSRGAHVAEKTITIQYGRLAVTRKQRVIRSGDGSLRSKVQS